MENLIIKLKEKFAIASTETLKRYYKAISSGEIPPSLSEFSQLDLDIIKKHLEEELRVRGIIKKVKRIEIK